MVFLHRLMGALKAESATLRVLRQGQLVQSWQVGPALDVPEAVLERMRDGRVYSQFDLPGSADVDQPLRALRWSVGADGFAVLLLQRRHPDFRAIDSAQLSRLSPYLGPALSGWQALSEERATAALEREITHSLGASWLLLSPSGRVISLSPDLAVGPAGTTGFRVQQNGRLSFPDPATAQAFRQALTTAQDRPGAPGLVELSRDPLLQLVISDRSMGDTRKLIAILRRGPVGRSLSVDRVARHFGLNRSEARLAMLLCDGFSLREAALDLGWTLESARSCSKQVFARMEVSGQPGVVRKMLGSAVWLG